MSEIEIMLEKEIGADLGSRQAIENVFRNIPESTEKVIMNFQNIEFIGRSVAQEYLNQKHNVSFEVCEKNMNNDVDKLFNIILKLNNKL